MGDACRARWALGVGLAVRDAAISALEGQTYLSALAAVAVRRASGAYTSSLSLATTAPATGQHHAREVKDQEQGRGRTRASERAA
jgi:hypothetical protein